MARFRNVACNKVSSSYTLQILTDLYVCSFLHNERIGRNDEVNDDLSDDRNSERFPLFITNNKDRRNTVLICVCVPYDAQGKVWNDRLPNYIFVLIIYSFKVVKAVLIWLPGLFIYCHNYIFTKLLTFYVIQIFMNILRGVHM